MIVVDTWGALALRDRADPLHDATRKVLATDGGPFLLSPFCLAEIDYLLGRHVGQAEQLDFLEEVVSGVYTLVRLGTEEVARGRQVVTQYADLRLSLADASIVVLAELFDTDRILTSDERDFRAVTRSDGRPFTLLPADS
ncbi:MAG: hypothetical protein WD689_01525 [Gaiellaceae bacterium]